MREMRLCLKTLNLMIMIIIVLIMILIMKMKIMILIKSYKRNEEVENTENPAVETLYLD